MKANQPGTDVMAVSEGYVSLTPLSLNWTNRALAEAQARFNGWNFDKG